MKTCPNCNENAIVATANFCHNCGSSLNQTHTTSQNAIPDESLLLDPKTIVADMKGLFFKKMKRHVEGLLIQKDYDKYVSLFYSSGFFEQFERRAQQVADEIYRRHCEEPNLQIAALDFYKHDEINALVDYFIIHHAQELNKIAIPEAILKYAYDDIGKHDLKKMILEILDLQTDKLTFYTDFVNMPIQKLKNATAQFLKTPSPSETPFLIVDQTVFGSCKEGFALTENGIYWKAHFNKAIAIPYAEIETLERSNDWLKINGHYFHVNKTLDYKMYRLLDILRRG